MSYPYDINPWDDNYNTNTQGSQNIQSSGYGVGAGGSGAFSDGYSNPMAQYSDNYVSDGTGQQYNSNNNYSDQQQQQQQQQSTNPNSTQQQSQRQPEPAFKRFLRAHMPLCGSLLDFASGINIPFLDAILKCVNRDLLVSKVFYFFFYSAFGSLFPLMGVYFKQLGMNPSQVGILTGVRPFIEIFSAPFWNSLAERFQKSKALLLFSLLSWIVFTYSLAHIRPPASACVAFNDTDYVLYTPYSDNDLSNYDVGQLEKNESPDVKTEGNVAFMNKMPNSNEQEDKNKILASEENENDQGRRKRRKRHIESGQSGQNRAEQAKSRLVYSFDSGNDKDHGYESIFDLNIDLENDFDDSPADKKSNRVTEGDENNIGYRIGGTSFFGPEDSSDAIVSTDYDDEMEPSSAKSVRYKRSAVASFVGDSEYSANDSDEPERLQDGGKEEQEEVRARERSRENWQAESEEEDEEEDESNNNGSEYGNNGNKKKGSTRHNHRQQQQMQTSSATVTATAMVPTTTMTTTTTTMGEQFSHANQQPESGTGVPVNKTKRFYKQRHKTPPTHIVGMSPITVEYAVNYNKDKHGQFVTPMFSTIVYKLDDIKEVFFLLLLLISLGEFFSAPAITIADSITLSYLGENTDLYGRQRMFGSFSWAITLLLVGMALDNSTTISDHPCGPHQRERSYTVCFAIFSLLMACAFVTATRFRFDYPKAGRPGASGGQTLVTSTTGNNTIVTTTVDGQAIGNIDDLYASTQPRNIFNTAPPVNAPPPGSNPQGKEKFEFLDKWKSAVFAQRTWELPEWVNVFRQFRDPLNLTYLFITWFLGCGVGLVFTFLFWHLQDVGGTPTLFGICSVINHISEILAYFFSSNFIKRFKHTKVSLVNS